MHDAIAPHQQHFLAFPLTVSKGSGLGEGAPGRTNTHSSECLVGGRVLLLAGWDGSRWPTGHPHQALLVCCSCHICLDLGRSLPGDYIPIMPPRCHHGDMSHESRREENTSTATNTHPPKPSPVDALIALLCLLGSHDMFTGASDTHTRQMHMHARKPLKTGSVRGKQVWNFNLSCETCFTSCYHEEPTIKEPFFVTHIRKHITQGQMRTHTHKQR